MNTIDSNIKSQGNEAAIMNILMYLDIEDVKVKDKYTFKRITKDLGEIYNNPSGGYEKFKELHWEEGLTEKDYTRMYTERQRQYEILANAAATNPHLADMKIGNQSMKMTDPSYEEGGLEACTFEDSNGNIIVAYRGTGSGEWIDNGEAISGFETDSEQQIEAMEYFDRIVEANNYNEKGVNIIITGHSKGGNKAQYTTINSKYSDLIDKCYNFDGQGMSPEAIKKFKLDMGEESFNEALSKMYGFYSENDYVNTLGIAIVPEAHRYYFESNLVKGVDDYMKYHYADDYLNLDGSFSRQTNQGNLSRLVEKFSLEMASFPSEIRSKVANAIMSLLQGKRKTVNGDCVAVGDKIPGFAIALFTVLPDLLGTPTGLKALGDIIGDSFELVEEKYGVGWKWIAAVAVGGIAVMFAPRILALMGISALINICEIAAQKIIEFGKAAFEGAERIGDILMSIVKGFKNWIGIKLNSGYRYASSNPHIKVNTDRLRLYEYKLTRVHRRIINLGRRLDYLYTKVGSDDLLSLIKADMLTGYSRELSQCISYLGNAAEEFDRAESKLVRQISRA